MVLMSTFFPSLVGIMSSDVENNSFQDLFEDFLVNVVFKCILGDFLGFFKIYLSTSLLYLHINADKSSFAL